LVSFRVAFLVAGCLNLLCLVPLHGLNVAISSETQGEPSVRSDTDNNTLLYVFVGLCMLVLTGAALRITYLPIDVTKHLGGSIGQNGTVMAVSPLAELLTLPAAGLLALKFRIGRLFSLGLAAALIEYVILSFNTALWQVYLSQAMDALVVAVVFGLGLTYAQELAPGRAGLASSMFGSAFGMATLVGNLIGAVTVPILGIPHIFFIPLATSGLALVAFVALDRQRGTSSLASGQSMAAPGAQAQHGT